MHISAWEITTSGTIQRSRVGDTYASPIKMSHTPKNICTEEHQAPRGTAALKLNIKDIIQVAYKPYGHPLKYGSEVVLDS